MVEIAPPVALRVGLERVFSAGTAFVPLDDKGQLREHVAPTYGGGPDATPKPSDAQLVANGLYPNAVVLGRPTGVAQVLGDGLTLDASGRLVVELVKGARFWAIELACGDTDFDTTKPLQAQKNKDGHYGVLGWSKLYCWHDAVPLAAGAPLPARRYLMERRNVPPK